MIEENRIDWLEKFLEGYEEEAKSFLKNDKNKDIAQAIIAWCKQLRSDVFNQNIERIVYDTAWLLHHIYNLGLIKPMAAVLGPIRGGKANKTNEGLILIIQEALKKSKAKTANGLWGYIKKNYTHDDFKSEYGTISFIDIDDPYWKYFKKEGILIAKKKRAKRGYLDITKENFIPFNTFKRYVREAKRNAGMMDT